MADTWIAECKPCGIEQRFDTQEDALDFASAHVSANHFAVKPLLRAQEKMGHVQRRDVAPGAYISQTAPAPVESASGEPVAHDEQATVSEVSKKIAGLLAPTTEQHPPE